jgi:glutaredoxin
MKRTAILIYALSMLATPLYAAQLYRWIDEKGSVEWRDTPPPATAKKVEQRTISVSAIPASELPYSVQQAMKNFPVTLWANDCGDLCDRARAHLNRRGVPHTDKNPQSEFEAFKKASGGGGEVPLLFVGSSRLKGYLESDWDAALDLAGYPKTVLTPIKPKPKAAVSKPEASEPPAVKLYTSADCGALCAQAKELLDGRGIKYEEIVVAGSTGVEELKKVSGDAVVPVLMVGQTVVKGIEAGRYHRELDQAGFRRAQAAAKP